MSCAISLGVGPPGRRGNGLSPATIVSPRSAGKLNSSRDLRQLLRNSSGMASAPETSPFTVTVHSGFTEDGCWLIDARLEWPAGPPLDGTVERGRGLMA